MIMPQKFFSGFYKSIKLINPRTLYITRFLSLLSLSFVFIGIIHCMINASDLESKEDLNNNSNEEFLPNKSLVLTDLGLNLNNELNKPIFFQSKSTVYEFFIKTEEGDSIPTGKGFSYSGTAEDIIQEWTELITSNNFLFSQFNLLSQDLNKLFQEYQKLKNYVQFLIEKEKDVSSPKRKIIILKNSKLKEECLEQKKDIKKLAEENKKLKKQLKKRGRRRGKQKNISHIVN